MSFLSPEELARLSSAESLFPSPIPVQSVSSDEFMPAPQTPRQQEFEVRIKEAGAQMAKRLGIGRRRFLQTAAGMATAFLAMNDTYGPIFGVSRAEAQTPEEADERAKKLSGQFIMDMHTHFLRPGTATAGACRRPGKNGYFRREQCEALQLYGPAARRVGQGPDLFI